MKPILINLKYQILIVFELWLLTPLQQISKWYQKYLDLWILSLLFLFCPLSKVVQYATKYLTTEEEEGPEGGRDPQPNDCVGFKDYVCDWRIHHSCFDIDS